MMNVFKLKKYTIALFVCFLSFFGYVNAQDVYLTYGSVQSITKGFKEGFECDGSALNAFKLEYNPGTGGYSVRYSKEVDGETKESVTCKWTADTQDGTGPGSITYTFVTDSTHVETYYKSIDGVNETSVDIGKLINLGNVIENLGISSDITAAASYYNLSCSGSTCIATLNSSGKAAAAKDNGFKVEVRLKFTPKDSTVPRYARVTILAKIYDGAKAYPGAVGTCSFSSDWTADQYESPNSGQKFTFYQTFNEHAKLPSCTVTNSLPVQFKGWVTGYDTGDHITAIGKCNNVLGNGDSVKIGESYAACYEFATNVVQLAFGAGSLNSADESFWTAHKHTAYEDLLKQQGQSGSYTTDYYYATDNASEKVTLPSELVLEGHNAGRVLIEWVNTSTGETVPPGTEVSVAGTNVYSAVISGVNYATKDRNKTIYVGEDEILSDSAAGYGTLCKTADSSKVTASFEGGKCTIKGVAATDSGSPVDVTLVTDSGDIVFKVTVIESMGQNQGGNSEFIIDTTPNIIIGENDEDDGVQTSMCTEFRIYYNDKSYYGTNVKSGTGYTSALSSTVYNVTPLGDCDTNSKYVSLCLDPGLRGPGGHLYVKDEEISADSDFGKLIQQIIVRNETLHGEVDLSIFAKVHNSERIAAHIAARIIALEVGKSAGVDDADVVYKSAFAPYKKISEEYTIGDDENTIRGIFNKYISFYDTRTDAGDGAIELLSEFPSQDPKSTDLEKMKVEYETKDAELYGSDGYKIIYSGTITLPPGMVAEGLEACDRNDALGIECVKPPQWEEAGQIGTGADVQNVYKYTVELIVADAKKVKLPSSKDEERSISFKVKLQEGSFINNIIIAKPKSGAKLQRMLVFDLGDPDVYVYFPPVLDKICTMDLDAVNPDNCTGPDDCDAPFNRQLFKEAGCCEELTDEVAYSYIIDSVCNGICTSSTFVEICEFDPNTVGSADLYEINEGTYKDFQNGTEQEDYHQCVVNVTDKYNTNGGLSSNGAFKRVDDVGEIRNIDYYTNNRYCQVTCKEDWQISMDAFGNYVGINAVAAGSYFQIVNNDVFMSGQRTCYTSFIDYDQYMKDLVKLSELYVHQYNIYSEASHMWTTLDGMAVDELDADSSFIASSCSNDCSSTTCNCDPGPCESGYKTDTTNYYSNIVIKLGDASDDHVDGNPGSFEASKYDITKNADVTEITNLDNNPIDYSEKSLTFGYVGNSDCSCPSSSYTTCYSSSATNSYTFDSDSSITITAKNTNITDTKSETEAAAKEVAKGYFDQAVTNWKTELEAVMNSSLSKMAQYKQEIEERSKEMFACQHFIQYNLSDDREGRNGIVKMDAYDNILFGNKTEAVQIDTAFEPKAAYTYDEKAFMTILGKDNVLEIYDYKNHTLYGGDFNSFKTTNVYDDATERKEEITLTNYDGSATSEKVELTRNAMETIYYNPNIIWQPDSNESRTYEDGTKHVVDAEGNGTYSTYVNTDYEEKYITFCTIGEEMDGQDLDNDDKLKELGEGFEWAAKKGGCYQYKIRYVEAHYIKNSIKNSSFYKNNGYWFNRGSDVKEHGDNLVDALNNANNAANRDVNYSTDQSELDRWSLLGTYNVFPISMTTPRNLYQYTYTFGDIGSYSNGELGRIMGKDKSIISLNHRTCFYEVYEEICLCCGDTINVHVENDEDDKTDEFLNKTPEYSYNKSILDKIISNTDGSISFATSSVSLGDAFKDADVADNWNNAAPFTYNGNNHLATDKGAKLLDEIEYMGEQIYDEEPEYSFYLDTTTLAAIREYNDSYGYDVNYNNLKVYGRYSIVPVEECTSTTPASGCKWETGDDETMNNSIINFQHYGSRFLEEVLPSMGNGIVLGNTLSNKTGNNNVCAIDASQVGTNTQVLSRLAVGTSATDGCRWIDYVEDIEAVKNNAPAGAYIVNKKDVATGRTERYYRLAFK